MVGLHKFMSKNTCLPHYIWRIASSIQQVIDDKGIARQVKWLLE